MPSDRRTRRRRHDVETSDYVAMLKRVIYGYGRRIGADPAALVHLRELEEAIRDAVNLGVFIANQGRDHYSQREQAAILGVTRQAIAKRIKLGEAVHVHQEATRAAGAVVRIADVRAARAAALAAAGVQDRTGSDRELRAAGGWR